MGRELKVEGRVYEKVERKEVMEVEERIETV
jgi:hypothetical protein